VGLERLLEQAEQVAVELEVKPMLHHRLQPPETQTKVVAVAVEVVLLPL
jgi:hypothetical protein